MQKLLIAFLLLTVSNILVAQGNNNPLVGDAEVSTPVENIGSNITIHFVLSNSGADDITAATEADRITVTIDLSKCEPVFTPPATALDALSGTAVALFDFTYNEVTRQYVGVQKEPMPSLQVFNLDISARVTELSYDENDYSVGASLVLTPNASAEGNEDDDDADALTRTNVTVVALPIDLVAFNGTASGCDVRLVWTTSMEEQFSHFVVERSDNGRDFTAVQTAKGKNNPAGSSYNVTVNGSGTEGYYRLRMVDLDGTYEFSHVIRVKTYCEAKQVSIAPNPATNKVIVNGLRRSSTINLFDAGGKLLQTVKTNAETHELQLGNFPAGIYFLRVVEGDSVIKSSKILKQ